MCASKRKDMKKEEASSVFCSPLNILKQARVNGLHRSPDKEQFRLMWDNESVILQKYRTCKTILSLKENLAFSNLNLF